jgi:hypothetical protein
VSFLGIEGIRVCRNAPSVSQLLFADDSLITTILFGNKHLFSGNFGAFSELTSC